MHHVSLYLDDGWKKVYIPFPYLQLLDWRLGMPSRLVYWTCMVNVLRSIGVKQRLA